MFFKGSRYEKVDKHEIVDGNGRTVPYKKVRFIQETRANMSHILNQGERLDHIAYRYYRDSERFWRICDANRAMWPDDLLDRVGRSILIPPAQD